MSNVQVFWKSAILLAMFLISPPVFCQNQGKNPAASGGFNPTPRQGAYWTALRKRREAAEAFASHGEYLRKQGKIFEAVAALKKALTLDNHHPIAYEQLAEIYADQGNWRDSVAMYRQLMNPNKVGWSNGLENDFSHLIQYSLALQNARAYDEARTVYAKALEFAPDRMMPFLYAPDTVHVFDNKKMVASLHLVLADRADNQAHSNKKTEVDGFLKQCLNEARAATAIAPNYAPAHLMLGKMFVEQSEWDTLQKRPDRVKLAKAQAVQAYKRAASLGNGETKAAAQTALKSYWLAGVTATP